MFVLVGASSVVVERLDPMCIVQFIVNNYNENNAE